MNLIEYLYRTVGKPIFFRIDPETVHDGVTKLGRLLGSTAPTRGLR